MRCWTVFLQLFTVTAFVRFIDSLIFHLQIKTSQDKHLHSHRNSYLLHIILIYSPCLLFLISNKCLWYVSILSVATQHLGMLLRCLGSVVVRMWLPQVKGPFHSLKELHILPFFIVVLIDIQSVYFCILHSICFAGHFG